MEYHKDRFDDYSLLVFKNEELVAILPANRSGETVITHQGLTYGGLILNRSSRLSEVLEIFKSLLKFLEDQGVHTLELKQMPDIYYSFPSDEMDYVLFKTQAELTRCDILSVVEPKLLRMSKDRKQGVKRGQRNKLEIRELNHFEAFWNTILIPNLTDKHKADPTHSLAEITLLKARFPEHIRQFNVYNSKGDIVAGTTIFETKHVAHSQYISGNSEKNKLGSLDLLHDFLLREVFSNKKYFDFGISNENQGHQLNEGLLYWKEGFGARSVSQRFFKIATKNHNMLNDIMI